MKQKTFLLLFLSITIVSSYIVFYKLGVAFLDDWDEAWYGEMVKQMLLSGQIVVLKWNGDFLFDKPPLYIWFSALTSSIFGLSEWSIRITSAIAGFLTIIIAFVYSYKKWGVLPSLLTYATLVLNNIYIWRVRSGNLDALVTFLIFLTFFAILWKNKWRYPVLGILYALIFLGKASLVAFPLAIFGITELLYHSKMLFKNPLQQLGNYLLFAALFIAPIAFWLYSGKQIAGQEFVEYYLFRSDQGVANISMEMFKTNYLWHTYYSLQRRFFFVFVFGLIMLAVRFYKKENLMLLSYSLFLLFLLSFTERDNNWYLTPSIPFWSLSVGFGTYQVLKLFPLKQFTFLIVIAILLPSIYVSQKTFRENIQPIIHTSSSSSQVASALAVREMSNPDEAIVRLDHLYPTAIYYSDRKVYASPGETGTGNLFMGRTYAAGQMESGELRFAMGRTGDVESFVKEFKLIGNIHTINQEESIFEYVPLIVEIK
jgi:4-amino-4-deoxy-L-arabinose transferase-like glycosyltransferase